MLPSIMSGMTSFFSLFIITLSNSLLRCMGHIVNLAQQSFICTLTGGTDDPNSKAPEGGDNDDELDRSEEHTSELQSHSDLVCRLLLEKKKISRERRACCRARWR